MQTQPSSQLVTTRSALALAGIVLIGAVLRLLMAMNTPAFTAAIDTVQYFVPAYDLVTSGRFAPNTLRPPLYPLFLAGVIAALGPSLEAAALVQQAVGLATVVLTYLLGALCFGRSVGLVAALGVAINGSLLTMERIVIAETLFTPLLLLAVIVLLQALRTRRLALFGVVGLVLGLGALARPAAQAVLPLALLTLLFAWPSWRRGLASAGVLLAVYVGTTAPWMLRNYQVHGVYTIATGVGDALYARLRRHDPEFDYRDYEPPVADERRAAIRTEAFKLAQRHKESDEVREGLRRQFGLTQVEVDQVLREASLQVIRQEPGRFVTGTVSMWIKLFLGFEKPLQEQWRTRYASLTRFWPDRLRFVVDVPFPDTLEHKAFVTRLTGIYEDYKVTWLFVPLFMLGTLRCAAAWRRGLPILPLIILSQLLVYAALDGPLARYRYPLQPLMTLVAAGGLGLVLSQIRAPASRLIRRRGALSAPATGWTAVLRGQLRLER